MNNVTDQLIRHAIDKMKMEEDKKFLAAIGDPISPADVKLAQAVIEKSMNDPKTVAEVHRLTKVAAEVVGRADSRLHDLINNDLLLYGSCFILTVAPFKREFRCPVCRTSFGSIRGFVDVAFLTREHQFQGQCVNCAKTVRVDIVDLPNDSEPKRQICLDPRTVSFDEVLLKGQIVPYATYRWTIPESLRNRTLAADPAALSLLPMNVLAAIISHGKRVMFAKNMIQWYQAAPDQPVVQSAGDPYRNVAKRTGLSQ